MSMDSLLYPLAGLFLPLFPLSMLFNTLFARTRQYLVRTLLLLVWPQLGLALLSLLTAPVDIQWLSALALFTSALYAYRAIAARELNQWSGYLSTSLWALLWLFVIHTGKPTPTLHLHALGFSLPLVLLTILGRNVEKQFGAVYTDLYGGLAQSMPRLSGALILTVLAVIATPLFPAFFSMTQLVFAELSVSLSSALLLLIIWLFWSWSGIRLLQGLVIGSAAGVTLSRDIRDISVPVAWGYALLLITLSTGSLLIMEIAQ